MANFLYVDNSNVWIEGMHVAAVVNGLAPDIESAQDNKICDQSWRIDFGRLMEFAGGPEIGRAVLYGSKPPPNDSLWEAAKRKGFEVVVHERSRFSGKEKKVDGSVITDMSLDAIEKMNHNNDEITLVAGDADYVPTLLALRERGFRFDVCFWDHASRELKDACSKFISLNDHLEFLKKK
jgi:uncharacterized LabA/DUF88 family protein